MTMGRSITAFSFALLASLASALVLVVQAQQNPGFISIDCGATLAYTEEGLGITYKPDGGLIGSGKIMQTSRMLTYRNNRQLFKTVRIFPNGTRNCYTLRPDQGKNGTYLIRATFWYGNYDGKYQAPSFDLYIDVNYWATVDYFNYGFEEIMYVSQADDIRVCLVNTGNGVPFISALELRALDDGIYRSRSGFLQLHWRNDIGRSLEDDVRYPADAYDRIWTPENYNFGLMLNTTSAIDASDDNDAGKYKVPGEVLRTAQTTRSASSRFEIKWSPSASGKNWVVYFHFVEIERLTSGLRREFTISMIDNPFTETVSLEYLKPVVVVFPPVDGLSITFFIDSANKSRNPPILNAVEFYTVGDLRNVPTAPDDVKAINDIKATYYIKRESWQGDPCVPSNYAWDGLNCSNENPPRIISLLEYANLCLADSCPQKKKQKTILVPVVTSVFGFFVVLFGASAIIWLIKRKQIAESSERTLRLKNRPFKYGEISRITGNFGRVIGEGGFGKVYLGTLDNGTAVAVKMLSESSRQGYKEFQAEAQLLMILHHRNLVSLLGYCNQSKHMALIYEYMANGNLWQHLSGKVKMHPTGDHPKVLTWSNRLQIAVDAAQGLDYLHNGCKPSIIHRDMKTTNILLNEELQAKVADFGLSRAFATEKDSHVSTFPAGTPGYVDPEIHSSGNFNKKSDVYSFGIVLSELITGRPAVMRSRDGSASMHILEWLIPIVESGDIQSIMDPRLQGEFDFNSAWKLVEIVMSCTQPTAIQRPDIHQVLAELESLVSKKSSGYSEMTSLELPSNEVPLAR
ncbi:putative leucine-rich repeat receptor-like serine/threonine-protein kinase At2g19230 isoform X3 [Syzygium oleosum]|uniref:putative leucine-rich repeat receptor-like serine/threonine-protein kinase At2g19230 isoform X3 n=1 Tax=Syzygium oleosum TaxID=219896 RepID=UPI0024B97B98|nr:putative leucine-rich repeat receptor-like serine/threonine-protein kinase At2g19230 isoform X3 [Syzygium oleosum]